LARPKISASGVSGVRFPTALSMITHIYNVLAHTLRSPKPEVVYKGTSKREARNKAHWMLKSGQSERSYIYCDGKPIEKYVFDNHFNIRHIK
jgi:hypothetical protein